VTLCSCYLHDSKNRGLMARLMPTLVHPVSLLPPGRTAPAYELVPGPAGCIGRPADSPNHAVKVRVGSSMHNTVRVPIHHACEWVMFTDPWVPAEALRSMYRHLCIGCGYVFRPEGPLQHFRLALAKGDELADAIYNSERDAARRAASEDYGIELMEKAT
jgi:hypothetical protein